MLRRIVRNLWRRGCTHGRTRGSVIAGGRVPGGGQAWLRFLLAAFVASFTGAGRTTKGFVKLPLPVGFRVVSACALLWARR